MVSISGTKQHDESKSETKRDAVILTRMTESRTRDLSRKKLVSCFLQEEKTGAL